MRTKKINLFSRIIYSLVGFTGLGTLIWIFVKFNTFKTMPFWSIIAVIISVIAMLNWGIVAISGNRNKDLFGLIGL